MARHKSQILTMRNVTTLLLVFVIKFFLGLSANAEALEVNPEAFQASLCEFEVNGTISDGASQKLEYDFESFFSENRTAETALLCLDSPGGNLVEGLKIAKLVFEYGVTTILTSNTECESACSWIFMSGTYLSHWESVYRAENGKVPLVSDEYVRVPMRIMHPSSKLGFHGFDVAIPSLSEENVNKQKKFLNQAFAAFLELRSLIGLQYINDDLAQDGFKHFGPDDFFDIDTVGEVIRNSIYLYGLDAFSLLSSLDRQVFCENSFTNPPRAVENYSLRQSDFANAQFPVSQEIGVAPPFLGTEVNRSRGKLQLSGESTEFEDPGGFFVPECTTPVRAKYFTSVYYYASPLASLVPDVIQNVLRDNLVLPGLFAGGPFGDTTGELYELPIIFALDPATQINTLQLRLSIRNHCLAKVVNVQSDDVLNIRRAPNAGADLVSFYPSDYKSVVLSEMLSNGWAETNIGYVHGRYVECL